MKNRQKKKIRDLLGSVRKSFLFIWTLKKKREDRGKAVFEENLRIFQDGHQVTDSSSLVNPKQHK